MENSSGAGGGNKASDVGKLKRPNINDIRL